MTPVELAYFTPQVKAAIAADVVRKLLGASPEFVRAQIARLQSVDADEGQIAKRADLSSQIAEMKTALDSRFPPNARQTSARIYALRGTP